MAKQKYKFERLTPIDNMDLDVYEEAIDYVFSNSDVKNVAISGAYSAGKSSVLASYKKKHDELRFLHISLAHFKSTDQESDAEVKESTLEGKILNQLIHQIPSEKIPQTNFRVKKTVSSKSIATSTISSLWAALLDANIVQYSECNIMDCFNAVKLNSSVVSYINQCDIDLDFSKTEYDENTKGALFDSVITCSDIGNSKYAQILSSLNFVYDDFDISGISDDKIAILIDKKIIRMTTDNLSFIRNNYPDQKFHFIHINMKEYVDTVGKTLFSQNELVEILTWDINDDLKISLLKMSKEPISIIGKGYSTAVCLHILSNNFAESDLPSLFSSFEQWDDSIQEKIFDHAVNNISCIIDNQDSIPTKLIKSLLNSESVSRDEKLDLFAAIMPGLCVDDIQSILILLNLTDYLKIFDMRSRPKFEINNESEKLLAAFKECHLIDSYEESTTKAGYYKVARPKATKALSKEPSTVT